MILYLIISVFWLLCNDCLHKGGIKIIKNMWVCLLVQNNHETLPVNNCQMPILIKHNDTWHIWPFDSQTERTEVWERILSREGAQKISGK